jgi:YidC/Oxa1 family membrane protein insertase
MLITLPIMFALYSVIYNIPAYVTQVKDLYTPIANALTTQTGYQDVLTTMAKGLRVTPGNLTDINKIIDILSKFGTTKWTELTTTFPNIAASITPQINSIRDVNMFFNLNIINPPGWGFPGILIPILAMALQFVQTKQISIKPDKNNPASNAMSSMNVIMPIMSGVFAITLPIGVGLYWIATSIYSIIQQYFVNRYLNRIDIDELVEKSVAKASKKKSRIQAVTGTSGTTLTELARKQTKSIDTTVKDKGNTSDKTEAKEEQNNSADTTDTSASSKSYTPGSISDIANILKNRNEKGDK